MGTESGNDGEELHGKETAERTRNDELAELQQRIADTSKACGGPDIDTQIYAVMR